jgi:hypothetical protein
VDKNNSVAVIHHPTKVSSWAKSKDLSYLRNVTPKMRGPSTSRGMTSLWMLRILGGNSTNRVKKQTYVDTPVCTQTGAAVQLCCQ